MATVDLTPEKWQAVLQMMAYAPARECVPLMNEIGAQLSRAMPRQGVGDVQLPGTAAGNSGSAVEH